MYDIPNTVLPHIKVLTRSTSSAVLLSDDTVLAASAGVDSERLSWLQCQRGTVDDFVVRQSV